MTGIIIIIIIIIIIHGTKANFLVLDRISTSSKLFV